MARKLLSLVVALAVVLSSMSFAFAADPKAVSADVTDAKVKAAVEKLVAFGMVEGIDGKYVPDQKLKRSELTKLIVMALGLGPAADAAKGATQFSDVDADHWASGFITVAAGQGIVQGMGDGTFSPDSDVTFAQGLTMLVRTLGYKDEFLKGVWPGNYLAKASEKGIYAGLSITPGAAVKRGDFAVMMTNTLDAKVVEVGEYKDGGVTYTESKTTTLMKDKFKLDKIEVRPIGNARIGDLGTDKAEFKFKKTYTTAADGVESAVAMNKDAVEPYTLANGVSVETLLGVSCYAYYSKDVQKITYIEPTGSSTVYVDGVDKFIGATEGSQTLSDVKLRWSGKQIPVLGGERMPDGLSESALADLADWYVTGASDVTSWKVDGKTKNISGYAAGKDFGRFIVESGKVVFADTYRYDETGYMIKEVDAEKNSFTYYKGEDENTLSVLNSYSSANYYLDGKAITLKDIKPWDVLYLAKSRVDSKDVANFFVFRNVKTGTVSAIIKEFDTKENKDLAKKVELDSKDTVDVGDDVTYSYDNNEDINYVGPKDTNLIDKLSDFVDTKVTIVVDNNKKIRHIYGEAVASESFFGVALTAEAGVDYKLKMYTQNDDTVTYSFEDEDEIFDEVDQDEIDNNKAVAYTDAQYALFDAAIDNAANLTIVEYKLNSAGKIAKNTVKVYSVPKAGDPAYMSVNGDFGENTVTVNAKTFTATKTTKVFDVDHALSADYAISSFDNFRNKDISNNSGRVFVIYDTDSKDIKSMFLIDGMEGITTDLKAGYLMYTYTNADDKLFAVYKVYGKDDTFRKEIDGGSVPSAITKQTEAAIIINESASGKVQILASATAANTAEGGSTTNWQTVAGKVYGIDGKKLTVGIDSSVYKYQVASDALIFNGKDVKTFGNIDEGDFVVAVVKNGTIVSLEYLDIKYKVDVASSASGDFNDSKATISLATGYYTAKATGVAAAKYYDTEGKAVGVAIP